MLRIGRLTICEPSKSGRTAVLNGEEIERQLGELLGEDVKFVSRSVGHDRNRIADAIRSLVDDEGCTLVLTSGGTGPFRRDVTPEATRLVIEKELPGFGEILRMKYYETTKTAVLLRVTAGIRSHALIVNLPGTPEGLRSALEILGPAIYECVVHIR
ncbi:MAG: molybdopterin adenylyltransferase [Opitutae bacterium]|nr:molybdopterin adenylyltransferase [Opitutae bacterium]MCD8299070.1 molybdopterin adenylyltransferase [Opitutae bacterium]